MSGDVVGGVPTSVARLQLLVAELSEVNAELGEVVAAQAERIAELEQRLGRDSSTSHRPPSADSPYRKPPSRSSPRSSGRKPGKQPGDPGSTMPLVADPDETIVVDPGCCEGCGAELAGSPVIGMQRRQVSEVRPPPPPWVSEYQLLIRRCAGCAAPATGAPPALAPARAQYGPGVLARAGELLCAHYLPVGRAAALMGSLLGSRSPRGSWPVSAAGPRDCWKPRSCPGSASFCARSACCTPMKLPGGPPVG